MKTKNPFQSPIYKCIISFAFILSFINIIKSQSTPTPLDQKEIVEVLDSINSLLSKNYVFPDVAKKMGATLQENLKNEKYKKIKDPFQLSEMLTADLQSVSHDKHLRVMFSPEQITEMKNTVTKEDSLAMVARNLGFMKSRNFGFKEIKFLPGNIGYLNLEGFFDTEYASETAVAAMNFLSNSDALIIDLRQNGGGSPSMIQLITSFLYGPESVHLNNFYWRPSDTHTQTWTLPYVPGNRRPDMPVYVLTSNRTFSAAEEFSYNLKNLNRATLVGETTGGGAHPGGSMVATDRFMLWVPSGRAINPITKTNWEGVGVVPHIDVPQEKALLTAHTEALTKLSDSDPDNPTYKWHLASVKAKANPITLDNKLLLSYAGKYGPRQINYENGKLYYSRDDGPKRQLIPMEKDLFYVEEVDGFRLKVISEGENVVAVMGMYDNGRTDKNMKNSKKITP